MTAPVGGYRSPFFATRRYHAAPPRFAGPLESFSPLTYSEEAVPFEDRQKAGQRLVGSLDAFRSQPDVVVIGIPKGGIIVAAEVARLLDAPLGAWVAQKLRSPHDPDRAIGSLGQDGEMIVDENALRTLRVSHSYLVDEVRKQRVEVARQTGLYANASGELDLTEKRVILVDDGLATGSTMRAALRGLKHLRTTSITIAAPIAPTQTLKLLASETSDVKVLETPLSFGDIGRFYVQFREITDREVLEALHHHTAVSVQG